MKTLMMTLLGLLLATSAYPYPGCTDPIALNYDPEATEDNGTCVYSVGPDLIIIDIDITNFYCNFGNAEVYQYTATIVNIGTEPVEFFCLDDFLSTSSYNCFNGLVNPNVYVEPLDTISVNGSISSTGPWVDGQTNYMTINSIPGEIFTGNNSIVFNMEDSLDCSESDPCDTVYVEVPIYLTDTITENDTIYIDVIIDNYIYVTDTITEYVTEIQYIDCQTGLPCDSYPGIIGCPLWTSVYVPNTFTPNNDNINDQWRIVYDLDCWEWLEFMIYNRWGVMIYQGRSEDYDSYPFWDGSINDGSYYASDGVYTYVIRGKKTGLVQIIENTGHITLFR